MAPRSLSSLPGRCVLSGKPVVHQFGCRFSRYSEPRLPLGTLVGASRRPAPWHLASCESSDTPTTTRPPSISQHGAKMLLRQGQGARRAEADANSRASERSVRPHDARLVSPYDMTSNVDMSVPNRSDLATVNLLPSMHHGVLQAGAARAEGTRHLERSDQTGQGIGEPPQRYVGDPGDTTSAQCGDPQSPLDERGVRMVHHAMPASREGRTSTSSTSSSVSRLGFGRVVG